MFERQIIAAEHSVGLVHAFHPELHIGILAVVLVFIQGRPYFIDFAAGRFFNKAAFFSGRKSHVIDIYAYGENDLR
jgi:hypothetical protein